MTTHDALSARSIGISKALSKACGGLRTRLRR
jgi:hypothetical protein